MSRIEKAIELGIRAAAEISPHSDTTRILFRVDNKLPYTGGGTSYTISKWFAYATIEDARRRHLLRDPANIVTGKVTRWLATV